MTTTASPGEKTELVSSLGADTVVNYREEKFDDGHVGNDYDFGFDTTRESSKMPAVVKRGGSVVTIAGVPTADAVRALGLNPNLIIRFIFWMMRDKAAIANASAAGVDWSYMFLNVNGADLEELAKYVDEGKIKPVLDNVWEFADWKSAVEKSFSGRAKGKCVVRISKK